MIKRFARPALVVAVACLVGSAALAEGEAQPQAAAPATDAAAAPAQPIVLNADHPDSYTVQPGDTLWGIAEKFLKNPWQWPEVWHVNEQVDNPHLIYPGMVLQLHWVEGRPVLSSEVATGTGAGSSEAQGTIGSSTSNVTVVDAQTVKLSPRIREMPVEAAIPAIPLRSIESFLTLSRVVDQDEFKKAPYIVAGPEGHLVMGRDDTVFARDRTTKWANAEPEYGLFRGGKMYTDPDTGEVLGYEATRVGNARIVERDGDIATMRVLQSEGEIRIDDHLLHTDQRKVQSVFYPRPAPDGVSGKIVAVMGNLGYASRNDVVVINKGERDKIVPGHVFSVLKRAAAVRDRNTGGTVDLPPVRAGMIIVFRTFEKVSYGFVTRSARPLMNGDVVRAPSINLD